MKRIEVNNKRPILILKDKKLEYKEIDSSLDSYYYQEREFILTPRLRDESKGVLPGNIIWTEMNDSRIHYNFEEGKFHFEYDAQNGFRLELPSRLGPQLVNNTVHLPEGFYDITFNNDELSIIPKEGFGENDRHKLLLGSIFLNGSSLFPELSTFSGWKGFVGVEIIFYKSTPPSGLVFTIG